MQAIQKENKALNIIFNIIDSLPQHLRYQQIYTYAHTILAYLTDSLTCMRQVTTQPIDYIAAAISNILSPNILPVEETQKYAQAHSISTSFNNAPAHIIRSHPSFLPIP